MIAVDTNLLVYSHMMGSPWNRRAHQVISDLAASGAPWAIPAHCLAEVYCVVTHPKIYRPASSAREAMAQIEAWQASPTMTVLGEDAQTWDVLRELSLEAKLVGPAIHDARVAAVCIQHHVAELWTADRDFSRFPQLRTRNPLLEPLPTRAGEAQVRYRVERRGRHAANAR